MINEIPNTKKLAKNIGSVNYFTGIECKNGHIDYRYTNTGICYACKRLQSSRCYYNNPDPIKERASLYSKNNKDKVNAATKEWVSNNREKRREITARYREKNRKQLSEYSSKYQKEKMKNPNYRLSRNLSKAIWESLKECGKTKLGKSYKDIVNFSLEELKVRLESMFRDDMTWDNYGTHWHLDHITPLSWFKDEDIMNAWELSNLQPLLSHENLSKNNRFQG